MAYLGTVLFVSAIISMLSDQLALAGTLLVLANICALTKDKSGSIPGFYLLTFGLSMGLYLEFDVVANFLIAVGSVLLGITSYNSSLRDKTDLAIDSTESSSWADSSGSSSSGGDSGGGE